MSFTISGTGCSLGDFLYRNIDFSSLQFKKYLSRKDGDGGLCPGKLVFTEEFEKFSNEPYTQSIERITAGQNPDTFNLGGPGIVSLINASQLLFDKDVKVNFYAAVGNDETGDKIISIVKQTPIDVSHFIRFDTPSPFTDVLSDPNYDKGKGERIFINNIGCAWELNADHLDQNFFASDMVVFGGTALVPKVHDSLNQLLQKAKLNNCITVVNTVYDFRNEKRNPSQKWPLGDTDQCYHFIDLLIMDMEEAFRLSGTKEIGLAIDFFMSAGTGAFIITHGAKSIYAWSSGKLFQASGVIEMPVSQHVIKDLEAHPEKKGDTTGCGDNFAGGVIAGLVMQLLECPSIAPVITESISWGVASGGYACYYTGGTYLEKKQGEKMSNMKKIYELYKVQ